MPFHQVGLTDGFCGDRPNHQTLTIGDFIHQDEYNEFSTTRGGNGVGIFIEIGIVEDPKYRRKHRAWCGHGRKYRTGRTPKYGWKPPHTAGAARRRCILDDEDDVGQIASDTEMNTKRPRNR